MEILRQSIKKQILVRHFARRTKGGLGKEESLGANFSFPKHKELFTEDYYNTQKETEFEDLVSSPLNDRFTRENPRHQGDEYSYEGKSLNIEGGILQNYRKVTGQTLDEVVDQDYWHQKRTMQTQAAQYFNNVSQNEKDMMNNTKNYVMRHRLNREISFNDDFRKKYMTNEYGNYEKYEKNKVSTVYDKGEDENNHDKFFENYMNLVKRLPTKEAEEMSKQKRKDINDMLTDTDSAHQEFPEAFFNWKVETDKAAVIEKEIDEEMDFLENPTTFETGYNGRMSPFVKETIYREYQRGMTIKDLSLKYGILHMRVKAIIFQKHMYWEEVYPKLGESHMRMALEREAQYASDFPFIEYGQDLHMMGEWEKGVKMERLTETEYDTNPHRESKEKVDQFLMKMRSRYQDRVPLELHGKGPAAYLLQEIVCHRGKGAARVSQNFKEMALYYGSDKEHLIKTKHKRRMDVGGIRYASQGDKWAS